MKLKLIPAALLLLSSGSASIMADVILSVNGVKVEKTVARLAFEGDDVKVTFGDQSESCYDMEEVSFSFLPSAGIGYISSYSKLSVCIGDDLEISGVSGGCTIQVFDLQGQILVQSCSTGDTCKIDMSHLAGGTYILKAGNEIVKFIKR